MFLIGINSSIEEIVKVLSRYPLNWFTLLKTRRFESVATKYVVAECQCSPPHIPSAVYGCMEFTLVFQMVYLQVVFPSKSCMCSLFFLFPHVYLTTILNKWFLS